MARCAVLHMVLAHIEAVRQIVTLQLQVVILVYKNTLGQHYKVPYTMIREAAQNHSWIWEFYRAQCVRRRVSITVARQYTRPCLLLITVNLASSLHSTFIHFSTSQDRYLCKNQSLLPCWMLVRSGLVCATKCLKQGHCSLAATLFRQTHPSAADGYFPLFVLLLCQGAYQLDSWW